MDVLVDMTILSLNKKSSIILLQLFIVYYCRGYWPSSCMALAALAYARVLSFVSLDHVQRRNTECCCNSCIWFICIFLRIKRIMLLRERDALTFHHDGSHRDSGAFNLILLDHEAVRQFDS